MKKNKISVWLMRKYLGWQQSMGELKSQAEFAKYLGFNPSTLSMWMTGKQDPDLHSADLLAHKLGPEVYDVLKLEAVYDELTPEQRQSLSDKINKILSDL